MRTKICKILTITLNMILLLSLLSGCSSNDKTKTNTPTSTPSKTSTESSTTNQDSKVNVTVDNNLNTSNESTQNTNTPAKTAESNTKPPVNPNASGAKNAVSSITSTPSTAKPKELAAVDIKDVDSFNSAIIVNLSEGKDFAINLSAQYTKDNVADKVMKVVETSGYAGYVSGIQYSITNNVAYIYFQYKGGSASFLNKTQAVDAKVQSIVNTVVNAGMSDYDKELALHDYVVNNVAYDYANLVKNTIPEDSYTGYGALIKGVAVCEGYAEAMHKLLNLAGVKSYIINGFGDGVAHQWNLVNIQGGIYHLDATFDDPISSSGQVITHNYFNLNDAQISKNHTWNSAEYPKSTAVAANYFIINNLLAGNKSKYYEIIKNELIKKTPVISIKTPSYEPKTYTSDAILKVLKDNKAISYVDMTSGYSFSYDQDSCVIEIGVNYK